MSAFFTASHAPGSTPIKIVERADFDRTVNLRSYTTNTMLIGFTETELLFPLTPACITIILPADEDLWIQGDGSLMWLLVGGTP